MGLWWSNNRKRKFGFTYGCTQEHAAAVGHVNRRRKFKTPHLVVVGRVDFSVVIMMTNQLSRLQSVSERDLALCPVVFALLCTMCSCLHVHCNGVLT